MTLEELVAQHGDALQRTANTLAGISDGDDLYQQTLVRLWENWDRYCDHPNPVALAKTIATNLSRDKFRVSQQDENLLNNLIARDPVQTASAEDCFLDGSQTLSDVYDAIARLSPAVREVMELVAQEYSLDEISELLDCSKRTISTRISRGRAELVGFL